MNPPCRIRGQVFLRIFLPIATADSLLVQVYARPDYENIIP